MECIQVFKQIGFALSDPVCDTYSNFCFKPKQVQCFEYLLKGHDVVAILPTGYGKSLVFHLLPWIIPVKSKGEKNIVLVVCPLSSIIRKREAFVLTPYQMLWKMAITKNLTQIYLLMILTSQILILT